MNTFLICLLSDFYSPSLFWTARIQFLLLCLEDAIWKLKCFCLFPLAAELFPFGARTPPQLQVDHRVSCWAPFPSKWTLITGTLLNLWEFVSHFLNMRCDFPENFPVPWLNFVLNSVILFRNPDHLQSNHTFEKKSLYSCFITHIASNLNNLQYFIDYWSFTKMGKWSLPVAGRWCTDVSQNNVTHSGCHTPYPASRVWQYSDCLLDQVKTAWWKFKSSKIHALRKLLKYSVLF